MKVKMLVKVTKFLEVEVSEETGYDVPDDDSSLQEKYNFIESVKNDFESISEAADAAQAEAYSEYLLESFTVEEG